MSCECKNVNVSTDITAWCVTCDKRFCVSCSGYHNENSHKCFNLSEKCLAHGEPLLYFCFDHDVLCCNACRNIDHGTCTKIEQSSVCAQNVLNSIEFVQAENELKELNKNLASLVVNRQENAQAIKEQTILSLRELETTRQDLIHRVNMLVDEMITDVKMKCKETTQAIERLTTELLDLHNHVKNLGARFSSIRADLTNLQIFSAVKQFSRELSTVESKTSILCKQEAAQETMLVVRLEQYVDDLISESQTLGEIKLFKSPCDIGILNTKMKQAQIIQPRVPFDINRPKVHIIREIYFDEKHEVTDCGIFPDLRMIFVHSNSEPARIYNYDGSVANQIYFSNTQFSVTVIDNDRFAVSMKDQRSILVYDIARSCEEKTINFENYVLACSYYKECLYVLLRDVGIAVVNMDGQTLNIIRVPVPGSYGFLACSHVGICYTITGYFTIFCDYSGHVKWKNSLGGDGISMDSKHNVFVTSIPKRNVRAISADGRKEVDLLPTNNDFPVVRAICCGRKHNTLLVVVSSRLAILYGFS